MHVQELPAEEVMRFVEDIGSTMDTDMKTTWEQLTDEMGDEWIAKGLAKGLEKGRVEALAGTLVRFLKRRFGDVPVHLADWVTGASEGTLQSWLDRVLDAESVEDVFAGA